MNHTEGRFHPFGRTLDEDLALIAQGEETGWWDDRGQPAAWPQDFLDPDAGWTNGIVYATGAAVEPLSTEPVDPATPPF